MGVLYVLCVVMWCVWVSCVFCVCVVCGAWVWCVCVCVGGCASVYAPVHTHISRRYAPSFTSLGQRPVYGK